MKRPPPEAVRNARRNPLVSTRARCPECDRTFDLTNETDAAEFYYGHDCEVD